jgi:hypothetical protein
VKTGLDRVRENLGTGNGAHNMAQLVLSLLAKKAASNLAEE